MNEAAHGWEAAVGGGSRSLLSGVISFVLRWLGESPQAYAGAVRGQKASHVTDRPNENVDESIGCQSSVSGDTPTPCDTLTCESFFCARAWFGRRVSAVRRRCQRPKIPVTDRP